MEQPGASGVEQLVDVVVVGAGLAGLVAAIDAAGADRRVVLVDAHPPGGRAGTTSREGFSFNQGPHALYNGGHARRVLTRLGVPVAGGSPPVSATMLRLGGRLAPAPVTVRTLLASRLLSVRSRAQFARLLGGVAHIDAAELAGESVAIWLRGRGLRPDADALMRTFIRLSTYGDDLDRLSADAAVAQVQLAVGQGVTYLDGGWQRLVDSLLVIAQTRGVEVHTGHGVSTITAGRDGWRIVARPRVWSAGAVVVAVGTPAAARRLLPVDPGWGELGPAASAACLDLGLRRPPPVRFVLGVDDPVYLSTHAPPADLAPPGGAVVQLLRYGARTSAADKPLLAGLAADAGIEPDDVVVERFLHRMVVTGAVPVPERGGLVGRPLAVVAGAPGLFVAGDWVGPVGMLADAALASGEAAAAAVLDHLADAGRRRAATLTS